MRPRRPPTTRAYQREGDMIQNTGTEASDSHDGGDHRLDLSVSGLSCAGDAAPLARRIERLPGVREALINPITERAVVRFDPGRTDIAEILRAMERLGIGAGDRLVRWHAPAPGCTCAGCSERLEARLNALAGVEMVILNPDEKSVTLEYVPSRTDTDLLGEALTVADPSACDSAN